MHIVKEKALTIHISDNRTGPSGGVTQVYETCGYPIESGSNRMSIPGGVKLTISIKDL